MTAAARRGGGARASWLLVEEAGPGWAQVEGRRRLLLCANDYLGLACDPRLAEAAARACSRYGAGARAARALGGDTLLHRELEAQLAALKGKEAALLFNSGFATNSGVIPALVGPGDHVFSDELNHASIVDGCRLSGARVMVYRHCSATHLAEQMRAAGRSGRALVVTDAVFSMDGHLAPLPDLVASAEAAGAATMVDEAHSTGVYGEGGAGAIAHFRLHGRVEVVMGTLGKALGCAGGYVAAGHDLVDHLAATTRSFVFTTAPPAPVVGASLAALGILREEPERVERLWANARRLHGGLREIGLDVPAEASPIIPVSFGDEDTAARVAEALFERGVLVRAVGPPYVPAGTSRLRVIASAAHDRAAIEMALDAFHDALARGMVPRSR
jgi:8-amino-7-oxononanoate synthase